ncbi:nucleosome assembly protein [Basidiobolus meristosporus CBS 931.73]|uniref:Nucleosome assembly protein n=1 Tax=Basidiobolus meristosporus CBS 931.73 TaxID=1314790 RepID=A0A1Y1YMV2_9FUNG|nr:nucleosome assembly protein [Basidiobolus meristosporus CBS 931.73]|eukprot:ORX99331.1 nucleosome assembly protein [Basidiobolus meristosporus CBS 931.73]
MTTSILETLPTSVKRRLFGLKQLQAKHAELELEFHTEILNLEKKYLSLYSPLYSKRTQIINGKAEPTEEEIEAGKKADEELAQELGKQQNEDPEVQPSGVPNFWLTALKNHIQLADLITSRDESALKHLVDIRLAYSDEKLGFKVEFEFTENEWFSNQVLSKTYYYQPSAEVGDLIGERSEGTEIAWKEGKDLSVTVETKKQRHKATNKTRVVKRTVPAETFFNFFNTVNAEEEKAADEEDELDFSDRLEADFEIGEALKQKIIPHAIDWYTGKALQYEGFDLDDYEDFEDITDEDEEALEDEESEEEYGTSAPTNQPAPECKQQ